MPEEQTDVNQAKEGSKSPLGIWIWLSFALFIYVFSVGPAAGIFKRTEPHSPQAQKTLQIIYAPLVFLVMKHTPFERPLVWWVNWWEKALEKKTS